MNKQLNQSSSMSLLKPKSTIAILLIMLFQSCSIETNTTTAGIDGKPSSKYEEIGDSISSVAQNELLRNVGREMKLGGPKHAINFCNIHASNIMDSLSSIYGTSISRISQQPRNQYNEAKAFEAEIMHLLLNSASNDTFVEKTNTYYKNIFLGMETCLKCHGNSNQIHPETQTIITEKYPNDKATGYELGDHRGAWKIVFRNP